CHTPWTQSKRSVYPGTSPRTQTSRSGRTSLPWSRTAGDTLNSRRHHPGCFQAPAAGSSRRHSPLMGHTLRRLVATAHSASGPCPEESSSLHADRHAEASPPSHTPREDLPLFWGETTGG